MSSYFTKTQSSTLQLSNALLERVSLVNYSYTIRFDLLSSFTISFSKQPSKKYTFAADGFSFPSRLSLKYLLNNNFCCEKRKYAFGEKYLFPLMLRFSISLKTFSGAALWLAVSPYINKSNTYIYIYIYIYIYFNRR